MNPRLTAADLEELSRRGISEDEVRRQLRLLTHPPRPIRLVRPCTIGDGIERLDPALFPELLKLHGEAAGAGRLSRLVPASGAASRMFQSLTAFTARHPDAGEADVRRLADGGDAGARDVAKLVLELDRFAFRHSLEDDLAAAGERLEDLLARGAWSRVARAVLGTPGLGLAARPKGLIEFHRYPAAARTALEEHLVESARTVADASGVCRLHVTVGPEHVGEFRARLDAALPAFGRALGVTFDLAVSTQSPSTDTVAVDENGELFRTSAGALLFRPGGHGALLQNLARLGGDLVAIRNIDNVVHEHKSAPCVLWKKLLAGYLVSLESDPAVRRARGGRPLRVCGVVKNEGEPGGGPFWVEGRDADRPQIVETSQVDGADPSQKAVLAASTHFNPVDIVAALRDENGAPIALEGFVDPATIFLARKSSEGRSLTALERPGLWNGAMAGWHTIFVEVPAETFAPVKAVFDLLRPPHQPD